MRIGRTLPPAAAPIPLYDVLRALPAFFQNSSDKNYFEKELIEEFGQKHCFLVSSGKAALTLTLTALKDLYPGRKEVLIPAFTCYSVPAAIKKAGLRVKLCDMAPSSLDFNKDRLQKIISANRQEKQILCIIVTHLFGCPADYNGIREIVGSDIPIIEDAAQAMGDELNGEKLGTLADAGFFSLGRGKALSTVEGGIIITSRDDLGQKIGSLVDNLPGYGNTAAIKLVIKTILISLLQHPLLFWLPKALPFLKLGETIYEQNFSLYKISSFQRGLVRNWRKRLDMHRHARIASINFWRDRLPDVYRPGCRWKGNSMIRLPLFAQTGEERDTLVKLSELNGLGIMPGYPAPINKIPEIAEEFIGQKYPHAQDVCTRLFTLPVHEFICGSDYQKINNLLTHRVASKDT